MVKQSDDAYLYFDGSQDVVIKVEPDLQGRLLGLCGKYNGDASDDTTTPDGHHEKDDVDAFADSWRLSGDACSKPACTFSSAQEKADATTRCFHVLMSDAFKECRAFINPNPFKKMCEDEICLCDSDDKTKCGCNAFALYSRVCAWYAKKTVAWRSPQLCRK